MKHYLSLLAFLGFVDARMLQPAFGLYPTRASLLSFPSPVALFRESQQAMQQAFRHSVPRYEITNDKEKFQIALDVPGVEAEDIHVELDEAGRTITMQGERKKESENEVFTSKFFQSFTLDSAADVSKITATLSDGVLFVTVPKLPEKQIESVRKIPITQGESSKDVKVAP